MNDIDAKIRQALQEDDARYLEGVETELPLHQLVIQTFRSRSRWLVVVGIVVGIVCMALAVFCAVQFFQADQVRDMLAWSLGFLFTMAAVMGMKIWYWLELQRIAITREVKRVELQLAQMSGRLHTIQERLGN